MNLRKLSQGTVAAVLLTALASASFAQDAPKKEQADSAYSDFIGTEPKGPSKPTPRTAAGHPDLTGFWKGDRATKPVGNIGKDLPGFKLPLTPAGEAALQHNLTATIDPESLCIIGGTMEPA